ncbi:MAG: methylamine utilization protein [Hahellaceae bacterium]|jgi:plastocyanin|nr:methylamine utilization protein [Hahellaceae bacterium]
MTHSFSALPYFFALFSLGHAAWATATEHFLVIDANNRPVADAVIAAKEDRPLTSFTASQNVAVMDQINRSFQPFVIDIDAGQRVSFPNSDNIRHHVYSFSPAKAFELKLYSGIPEAPLTFADPGIVVLGCNIHDSMVGYIYVSASPHHSKSNAEGKVTLDLPKDSMEIHVWHPSFSLDGQKQLTMSLHNLPVKTIAENQYRVIQLDSSVSAPGTSTSGKNSFKSNSKFKSSQ